MTYYCYRCVKMKFITHYLQALVGLSTLGTSQSIVTTAPANESDAQFYGQSPPVYPCRMCLFPFTLRDN